MTAVHIEQGQAPCAASEPKAAVAARQKLKPGILAVVGPTAVGKSRLALAWAKAQGAEIVACDAVQIYRGFDIGSAKPSPKERAQIVHHGLDVASWQTPYNAAQYVEMAQAALCDIARRGKRAVVCGGSGLYLRALRYGLAPLPPACWELRQELLEAERLVPKSLHARLAELDPESALALHPANTAQILRALEICLTTQQPASVLRRQHGFQTPQVALEVRVVDTGDATLRATIQARTQAMLAEGLIDEVRDLLAEGAPPTCQPMRAVGYRQVVAYLQEQLPKAELATAIERATWQYVRRQRTWWRHQQGVVWVAADEPIGYA